MESIFEDLESMIRHNNLKRFNDTLDTLNTSQSIMQYTQEHTKNTLLHISCQNAGGGKNLIKSCLRRGSDINAVNNRGNTPLHYCYEYGHVSIGEYLISKGANTSITNNEGLTPFEGLRRERLDVL